MSRCVEPTQAHSLSLRTPFLPSSVGENLAAHGGKVPVNLLDELLKGTKSSEEDLVEAIQALKLRNEGTAKVTDRAEQLHMKQKSILQFHEAELVKKSFDLLGTEGYAVAPLFRSEDKEERIKFMAEALEKAYLQEGEGGRLEVTPETSNLWRIRSQKRFMLHFNEKVHADKVGDKFMAYAGEAAQTMADLLQALCYGHERKVDVEKLTGLISPEGEPVQDMHTDQDREEVRKKRMGAEKQTRSGQLNGVPAPFSCICALREPVYLHVISGSHRGDRVDDFDWEEAQEIEIPPGYGVLFHGCIAHAGSSYSRISCRLHIYLKCSNDTASANNEIKWLNATGDKPAARTGV